MICVVGESLIDVVIGPGGDERESVGGSPLNVAVGLARLDVPTYLITQAGHDERGERVVEHILASEVELLASPTASGRTSTATARVDAAGVPSYTFDVEWTLAHQELPACDALHVGSLGSLVEPGRDSVLDLVDQAYARDVFVSFDPNVRADFLEDAAAVWRDIESLAERATLVKLSIEDVELLHPGADPDDIARSLLGGERTELVLLTRGATGASAYVDGLAVDVAAPEVEVADTVGAGDAFMAAALTVLFESDAMNTFGGGMPHDREELERVLGGAVQVAGLTCSRRGADSPRRAELPPEWPG